MSNDRLESLGREVIEGTDLIVLSNAGLVPVFRDEFKDFVEGCRLAKVGEDETGISVGDSKEDVVGLDI